MTHDIQKTNISGDEARAFYKKPTTFVLDVRTPQEFQGGALPRAVLIPVQELQLQISELPEEKTTPILVYCAHGVRSLTAQAILQKHGYSHVVNLSGGIVTLAPPYA